MSNLLLILGSYFSGVTTLIAGTIAWLLYAKQRADEKMQAARVLLAEIRTAEERINQIKDLVRDQQEGRATNDFPSVFQTKSWDKYSHLFARDFDQDELRLINDFYNYSELIDGFSKKDNNFFWINSEERARTTQQMIATLIKNGCFDTVNPNFEEINSKIGLFMGQMDNHGRSYSPKKTINSIQLYLSKIQFITTSTCGAKLKHYARLD
jgi:hypothetical protein